MCGAPPCTRSRRGCPSTHLPVGQSRRISRVAELHRINIGHQVHGEALGVHASSRGIRGGTAELPIAVLALDDPGFHRMKLRTVLHEAISDCRPRRLVGLTPTKVLVEHRFHQWLQDYLHDRLRRQATQPLHGCTTPLGVRLLIAAGNACASRCARFCGTSLILAAIVRIASTPKTLTT
jgi:hypothetical protein